MQITGISDYRGTANVRHRLPVPDSGSNQTVRYLIDDGGVGLAAGAVDFAAVGTAITSSDNTPGSNYLKLYGANGFEMTGIFYAGLVTQPVCFTTSTLIRTARGEVAVEDLIVGDLAVTASGTLRPIT